MQWKEVPHCAPKLMTRESVVSLEVNNGMSRNVNVLRRQAQKSDFGNLWDFILANEDLMRKR